MAVFLLVLTGLVATATPAQAATNRAVILFPFNGNTWISGEGPGQHHVIWKAWSEDLHAPVGTPVKARFASTDGAVTLRVASITNTCAAPNNAGKNVIVDVYVGDVYAGQILYGHLNSVAVSVGASIAPDTTLGYLNNWAWSSCWQDTTSDGVVHTHIEVAKGCYRNLPAWTYYPQTVALGMLASSYGSGNVSVCDEAEVAQVMNGSNNFYQSFMGDFNGDSVVDMGLRNPVTGMFYTRYGPSFSSQTEYQWDNSVSNYQSFMGDWNGDGYVDIGLRYPGSGTFYVRFGPGYGSGSQVTFQWDNSVPNYQAFVGDFNGDNLVDVGLRNPYNGWFYTRYGPSFTAQTQSQWDNSVSNYQSFMGDFNGDNITDIGLRNPTTGMFYARYGPAYTVQTNYQWDNSAPNYQAFMGDWNGDNIYDIGLRYPGNGVFYARHGWEFSAGGQISYDWDNG